MITILHGDNIAQSRTALGEIRARAHGKEVRSVLGSGLDEAALTQAVQSSSLFGGETLIVLENVFGKLGRKTAKIEAYAAIIKESSEGNDIVVWEDRELTATVLKEFGSNVTTRLFKTPTIIFSFLDGLSPTSAKGSLVSLAQVLEHENAEVVFALIVRRVRQLLMLGSGVTPVGLQGWQASRLTSQARLFTIDELTNIHTMLYDTDRDIKTGATPFSLAERLEQLVISL